MFNYVSMFIGLSNDTLIVSVALLIAELQALM